MPYGYAPNQNLTGTAALPAMGGGFLNPYTMIILILIVLQWFRVGSNGGSFGFGGGTPEPGLLNNGGLFIIAIFLLVFCSCGRSF